MFPLSVIGEKGGKKGQQLDGNRTPILLWEFDVWSPQGGHPQHGTKTHKEKRDPKGGGGTTLFPFSPFYLFTFYLITFLPFLPLTLSTPLPFSTPCPFLPLTFFITFAFFFTLAVIFTLTLSPLPFAAPPKRRGEHPTPPPFGLVGCAFSPSLRFPLSLDGAALTFCFLKCNEFHDAEPRASGVVDSWACCFHCWCLCFLLLWSWGLWALALSLSLTLAMDAAFPLVSLVWCCVSPSSSTGVMLLSPLPPCGWCCCLPFPLAGGAALLVCGSPCSFWVLLPSTPPFFLNATRCFLTLPCGWCCFALFLLLGGVKFVFSNQNCGGWRVSRRPNFKVRRVRFLYLRDSQSDKKKKHMNYSSITWQLNHMQWHRIKWQTTWRMLWLSQLLRCFW